MKDIIKRIAKLFFGIFLYSVGIVMTVNANLGLAPWDVFHQGLANKAGITMGQASIIVGMAFVVLDSFLGERLGWGTIANMLFIGGFFDLLMFYQIIPVFQPLVLRFIMMLSGMFVIGIASYFYISSALGTGPRDGLMVALTKRTDRSVRFIRNCIELCALVIGFFLGGSVGMGTVVMAVTAGYFIQLAFRLFRYDVTGTKHRFIDEDIKYLKDRFFNTGKMAEPEQQKNLSEGE
ncbi:MAG TPA: hypothetical protein VN580_09740 [Clostridia bacterium]|nr:hypothetical protein [Clostridia bacterium]